VKTVLLNTAVQLWTDENIKQSPRTNIVRFVSLKLSMSGV